MEAGNETPYGGWWMTPEEEAELERMRKQRSRAQEEFNRDIWERDQRIRALVHGEPA
jgi:hypothetical protein